MSSTRRNTAVFTSPAPGSRRPRFTREQIGATALSIADAEGLEAVSMRRLAEKLDAGTMTIYHYVRTKDELLALMHDALAGEIVVTDRPLPKQWRAAVTLIARTTRAAFIRHPKLLNALGGMRLGPNVMRHVEQSFAAVANAPCSDAEKQIILAVVDDFVFGSSLRSLDEFAIEDDFIKVQLETGEFPHLQRAMASGLGPPTSAANSDSANLNQFEFGLAALLDGIEQRIKAGTFSNIPRPVLPRTAPAPAVPAVKRARKPKRKRT